MQTAQQMLNSPLLLMEGALGERLKREYQLAIDGVAGMAHLIETSEGRAALRAIWLQYADIARRYRLPFVATTPTRRASHNRIQLAGLPETILKDNLRFLQQIRNEAAIDMLAGGMVGCAGDAYTGEGCLPYGEAWEQHRWAVAQFQEAGADFLYAALIPTLGEALGVAHASAEAALPCVISFTIQSDGRLMDGTTIADAIRTVDAAVSQPPVFYMTNCVHPNIVYKALSQPFNRTPLVRSRFAGIQANTSDLPYSALDASPVLHSTPPQALAQGMLALKQDFGLRVFGGCCGTDQTHMEAIASAISGLPFQ